MKLLFLIGRESEIEAACDFFWNQPFKLKVYGFGLSYWESYRGPRWYNRRVGIRFSIFAGYHRPSIRFSTYRRPSLYSGRGVPEII